MPTYKNLPANRLELLDGNLIVDTPIEGNVVLIIGTAYSGPTGKQVLMNDSNLASKIYGAGSELLTRAAEARIGGAKNVLLYRIGGKAASIDGIFGPDSYIRTVDQTAIAGGEYSIYIGPQPSNPALACIIVFQGSKIVYSNVPGAEVDLGKIQVEGFVPATFTQRVGTPTAPVVMQSAIAGIVVDSVDNFVGNGTTTGFSLTNTGNTGTVVTQVKVGATVMVAGVNYNLVVSAPGTSLGRDEVVFVTPPINNAAIEVKYSKSAHTTTELQTISTIGATSVVLTNGINNASTVAGVKLVNGATTTVFAAGNGTAADTYSFNATTGTLTFPALVSGDTLTVNYKHVTGTFATTTYSAGENNINASWEKLYEMLDAAYTDLENTIATEIVISKAILDAPNVADGSVATNKLNYVRKYPDANGDTAYEWSANKVLYKLGTGTTTVASAADVDSSGQPIVSKQFHEVNFAHQLGEFLNSLTENDRFVLGFIGTSGPATFSNAKIASWIGVLPETDVNGAIIGNGTGLLGNKFLAGSISRQPGFYKTDSGFPDGIVQQDSNGAAIDLGKFLSIVPGLLTLPASGATGTSGQSVNGASIYCGLATTIVPGNSTTNALLGRVGIPFPIKKPKLDELSLIGYVVFQEKDRGIVCVSGELATNAASDYDYISTSIIVRNITNSLRSRLDGFIGQGIDQVRLAAMQTAVDTVFKEAVRAGMVKKYIAQVLPTSTFGVTIQYTIVPVFELRDISNIVKLSYDI